MIFRLSLSVVLIFSTYQMIYEACQFVWNQRYLRQYQDREALLAKLVERETQRADNIRKKVPRTLHQEARKRGFHLPGEVDWGVLESRNALRWPDFWDRNSLED